MSVLSACIGAPAFEGEAGDHFDGNRFINREPMHKSFTDFVRLGWGLLVHAESWPHWVETPDAATPAGRVETGVVVTYISHATFLLQVDGLNILTDPVYAERASPVQWAGPRRVHAPGIAIEDLPPIDVVLISHNHYDHLDSAALQQLVSQQNAPPLVLAGLGNGLLFEELGLQHYRDMDWNDTIVVGDSRVHFIECRHRSGRGLTDQMKTLWGAFVIEAPSGHIYFGGDSGYGPHYRDAGERFGRFVLSLLPIGAYQPRWFMADVHMDPAEAVRAHLDLRSELSIGMHFGTFQLTYEAINQPVIDLADALREQGVRRDHFAVLDPGESKRVRPLDGITKGGREEHGVQRPRPVASSAWAGSSPITRRVRKVRYHPLGSAVRRS
ncbi:MAG: MBL fold metallo-hydrolase [Halioglobus sp.]|nr:MBL fold metallo-hydrolase [Halioglobus sp.]